MQVIHRSVKITSFDGWQHISNNDILIDVSMVLTQLSAKDGVVCRAIPVHTVVNNIFDLRVPSCIDWKEVVVFVEVGDIARVLDSGRFRCFAIANANDQVASAVSFSNVRFSTIQSGFVLENITEDEHPRLARDLLYLGIGSALSK